jgi:hypothetical protein
MVNRQPDGFGSIYEHRMSGIIHNYATQPRFAKPGGQFLREPAGSLQYFCPPSDRIFGRKFGDKLLGNSSYTSKVKVVMKCNMRPPQPYCFVLITSVCNGP